MSMSHRNDTIRIAGLSLLTLALMSALAFYLARFLAGGL